MDKRNSNHAEIFDYADQSQDKNFAKDKKVAKRRFPFHWEVQHVKNTFLALCGYFFNLDFEFVGL